MKTDIKEDIQTAISNFYTNKPEVLEFQAMVKALNGGKWINKDDMIQKMISYMTFNEKSINDLAKLQYITQVNYEALKITQGQYHDYYKAVIRAGKDANELMDELGINK